jgi:cold shock CspA family protein
MNKEDIIQYIARDVIREIEYEYSPNMFGFTDGNKMRFDPPEVKQVKLIIGRALEAKPTVSSSACKVYYPPSMYKKIYLIQIIARRKFNDWLLEHYSDLDETTNSDLAQLGTRINQECESYIGSCWDELFSRWIDIEFLNMQDPNICYGRINWYDEERGFGVISGDIFLHHTNIQCKKEDLHEGQNVMYFCRPRLRKKGLEAYDVKVLPPDYLATWPKMEECRIEGFSTHGKQDVIVRLEIGSQLKLMREPNNPYDKNVVRVDSKQYGIVGYLGFYPFQAKDFAEKFDRFKKAIPCWVLKKEIISSTNHFEPIFEVQVLFPFADFNTTQEIEDFVKIIDYEEPTRSTDEMLKSGSSSNVDHWFSSFQEPEKSRTGETIEVNVVGVTYEGRQKVVAQMTMGEEILLRREPDNPYDCNAIAVDRMNGQQTGYISRQTAAWLSRQLDNCKKPVTGIVTELTGNYGVKIRFTAPELNLNYPRNKEE